MLACFTTALLDGEPMQLVDGGRARRMIVPSPQNRGYGPTVRRGLKLALETGADAIACLHRDGQYPPENLAFGLKLTDYPRSDTASACSRNS